ncbi:MAG: ROK family protein [Planctomycetota bacterium]
MGHFLTLDIGGTKIAAQHYDERLEPIGEVHHTPTSDVASPTALRNLIANLGEESGLPDLKGVGVSVAGTVDPRTGLVHRSPNAAWLDGTVLQFDIERTLAVPAAVENDANCFALAEARRGAAKDRQNVIGLTLGTGVGGGIVLNGKLHHGSGVGSGELGHSCINYDGPECSCGSTGCLEAYIGGWAIPRTVTELFELTRIPSRLEGAAITGEDLLVAAQDGDDFARFFWHQYANWLAIAAASWVNVLRPDAIVFGGSGARSFGMWREQFMIKLRSRILAPMYERMLVTTATCALPGNLGAALVLQERIHRIPSGRQAHVSGDE